MIADAAYLAGLIDGEGSVSVNRTRTGKSAKSCRRGFAYRSSLTITMTDMAVLKWAQKTTGVGAICKKKTARAKHKPAWAWAVWSVEAADLLRELRPYLKVKRKQADNLITFQSKMRRPGSNGLTDHEWEFREECRVKSLQLNKRGVS